MLSSSLINLSRCVHCHQAISSAAAALFTSRFSSTTVPDFDVLARKFQQWNEKKSDGDVALSDELVENREWLRWVNTEVIDSKSFSSYNGSGCSNPKLTSEANFSNRSKCSNCDLNSRSLGGIGVRFPVPVL
ncbi:unnamed protein product [Gongylonema pulchrum]|uniref:DUF3490 domain-containing protein n=1 Tax=Gongylonema pulchrum TaxID=637853 RepID=A0A183D9I0_9BILA|nr:unnamed protein product [Gongylonema pulchrum]